LHRPNASDDSTFSFKINSHNLHNVAKVKDLEVLLTFNLKWSSHIS